MKGISVFEVLKKPSIPYHSPLEESWYNAIEEFMKKLDQYKGYVNPSDVTGPQAGDWCINDEGVWVFDGTNWQQIKAELPTGIMCFWADDPSSLPPGWILCDGSNGTPDIKDRFIIGVSSNYPLLSTGGSLEKTHSHSSFTVIESCVSSGGSMGIYVESGSDAITVDGSVDYTYPAHVHDINVDSLSSHSTSTPPPYYALYLIRYVGE